MKNAPTPLPTNFFSLPTEVAWQVFSKLSPQDLITLSHVSPQMMELVHAFQHHQHDVWVAKNDILRHIYS
jgi:hypothetical protein